MIDAIYFDATKTPYNQPCVKRTYLIGMISDIAIITLRLSKLEDLSLSLQHFRVVDVVALFSTPRYGTAV